MVEAFSRETAMMEPQNSQRGVIGEQHGLQRLTDTLEALSRGQTAQQQRDIKSQEQLDVMAYQMSALTMGTRRLAKVVVLLAVLTGVMGGLVGWQMIHRPEMAYVRALGALDQAVVQQWSSLPKPVQDQLSTMYSRVGLQPPGQRK
jgi:hypothetical protein